MNKEACVPGDRQEELLIRQIEERAKEFELLDFNKLTPREIAQELTWVISPNTHRGAEIAARIETSTYPFERNRILWRARALTQASGPPFAEMNAVADAWEPPSKFVKSAGRLNKPNEPLLYTCLNTPFAAPLEARIRPGEQFALIKFRTARQLNLTGIQFPPGAENFPKSTNRATRRIRQFLDKQFSRRFESADSGTYILSEIVAKEFADLPPAFHDGWIYGSVAAPGHANVTVVPTPAHEKLNLTGMAICNYDLVEDGMKLSAQLFTDGSCFSERMIWQPQGSELQEELFPEFTPTHKTNLD